MARIRTIKPEFWSSPDTADVSRDARLTFIGLWNESDDHGRLELIPPQLCRVLFPYDDDVTAGTLCDWLNELANQGLIVLYAQGRRAYLHITGWSNHQRIDHPSKPRCPDPEDCRPLDSVTPMIHRTLDQTSRDTPATLARPSRDHSESVAQPSRTDRRTVGPSERGNVGPSIAPADADADEKPTRKPDLLWDAVVDACRIDTGSLTKSARGRINKAVAELREAGADPGDVPARARAYRHKYPEAELTSTALAAHWPQLADATTRAGPVTATADVDVDALFNVPEDD